MEGCYWIQYGSHHYQVNIVWENIAKQHLFSRHHLNNQLAWLGLIQQGASLAGIVLTGWARWDFDESSRVVLNDNIKLYHQV